MKLTFALLGCAAAQDVFLASNGASTADLARAQLRSQPGRLAGSSAEEIAQKLNEHMSKVVSTKPCDDHSIEELNEVVRGMFGQLSDELQQIYQDNGDARARRFATLAEYEQSWMDEEDSLTRRHAKCFEIAEMWAHHLSDVAKRGKTVPTVPVFDASKADDKLYESSATCQTGHAMIKGGDGTSTHEWPDWPEELHYKAKAHGAYPFWWGGGSDSGSADMEVYWSEKQGAEKFIHSSCTGQSSWLNGACTHLMIAGTSDQSDSKAYLYKADESKCCISNPGSSAFSSKLATKSASGKVAPPAPKPPPPGGSEKLSPSQGNFYKTLSYVDERDFNGVYYQGKAKYYKLTGVNEPVREFWYFTDLDGKPVQQGEAGTGPTDQGYPTSIGHTIWHDYDPDSLDSSAIDPSVFAVPEACKTTTLKCNFP
jgi:hypothetical protein